MNENQRLDDAVKRALDEHSESLDGATLSRLRQARAAALDQVDGVSRPRRLLADHRFLPAAGLAGLLAAVIGLSVWLQRPAPFDPLDTIADTPDLPVDIAVADVDVELLEEIDFYDWLTLMETNGDSA